MWLQFEEKTVRKVQKNMLELELKHKRPGEILLIYDNDRYMGYLGWEKEVWNRPENIVSEYVVNETADRTDIEAICEPILLKKPIVKIPVFTRNKEADKINFVGKVSGLTDCENELLIAIQSLEKTISISFKKQLSNYKGVLLQKSGWIFDQLEELFEEYGLNVLRNNTKTIDKEWLILNENQDEYKIIIQSIFKEADFVSLQTYLKVKAQLKKKGIPVILIAFPENSELELTSVERYREERGISFGRAREIVKEGTISEQKELAKIYQREISSNDIKKAHFMNLSQGEENTLYLCGPCIIGGNAPEGDRFPEVLYQEVMCKFGYKIERVIVNGRDSVAGDQLLNKEFKKNDFVMIIRTISKDLRERFRADIDVDMVDFFRNRSKEFPWFSDSAMHITGEGSRQLVKYLAPILVPFVSCKIKPGGSEEEYKQIKRLQLNCLEREELESYFRKIEPLCFDREISKRSTIGAIVMNCNPFTNGHKYLIEQAGKQVDGLYIFVVEEDLSVFPFEDRIALVKSETESFGDKVKVIPSGRFVLSARTFPSYFSKETLQSETVDVLEDLTFFGQFIAPRLHIDIRFFGEEPIDLVTRQYNENMKRKLHFYGVKVKEIPRVELEGRVISASIVREAWKENNWNLLKELVPSSTLKYLSIQDKEVFFKREEVLRYEKRIPPKRREQLRQIRWLIDKTGMAILYGTGLDAEGIVDFMEEKERNQILFCDKKAEAEAFCFEGIPVITPGMLLIEYQDKGIYITTTRYVEEIFGQLMDGGIAYSNILFNPYPGYTIA